MCVWCTEAPRWLSCLTLAGGDLSWWRGLSEINLLNWMPVLVLTHISIKIWTCLLRALSSTCARAEEGEVQSMHGGFVQQCTQNDKPCIMALFMQSNLAIPFHCLKEICLCHCNLWLSPVDTLRWVSSGSERSAVQFSVQYTWNPSTAEWLCAVLQCMLFGKSCMITGVPSSLKICSYSKVLSLRVSDKSEGRRLPKMP